MYNLYGDYMKELDKKFYELESSLFKKEYLSNKEYLENIFHDNYMEYGKSGLIYYKQDTILSLYGSNDRDIVIDDLYSEKINDNVYIVHYVSIHKDGSKVLRSSIWIYTIDGYKLYFHQGTIASN